MSDTTATTQPFTRAFVTKLCATYQATGPIVDDILQEQLPLKVFIAMLRAGAEVQGAESNAEFIKMLSVLITHFEKVAGVLAAHHEMALLVNAVLREHQEDTV